MFFLLKKSDSNRSGSTLKFIFRVQKTFRLQRREKKTVLRNIDFLVFLRVKMKRF